MVHRYVIALGSNRPHGRHGSPRRVIRGALDAMTEQGLVVEAVSPVLVTRPLGPSSRAYANAAATVRTRLKPPALLAALKALERDFGRRRGQRWGARTLDCDIVLWDGGVWGTAELTIPHPAYRERTFVLKPLLSVAAGWRDPISGLTPAQLHARLTSPRPLPIRAPAAQARALSSVGRATDF